MWRTVPGQMGDAGLADGAGLADAAAVTPPDVDALRAVARDVLATHGLPARSLRLLGAGLDHAAFEADGEVVVRIAVGGAGESEVAAEVRREAELLRAVAAVVPVAVPVPLVVDGDRGCLAYRRLPGRPLLGLPDALDHASEVGSAVGAVLAVLHAQPTDRFADLLDVDDVPADEWLAEARAVYAGVAAEVPAEFRPRIEAFLDAAPPAAGTELVVAHNDLGAEHLLVDPDTGELTGLLDWSDAALTDPARDLALVLRDLGPVGFEAALRTYGEGGGRGARGRSARGERALNHGDLRERAILYARCAALEDLAYGLEPGHRPYADAARRALGWLFPPAADPSA